MDDVQIQSYEALREYLRSFTNFGGNGRPPYDENGVLHLLLALVDNLRANGLDPGLAETITPDQAEYLAQLANWARAYRGGPKG